MLQLVDAYCKPLLLYGSEVYWGLNLMTLQSARLASNSCGRHEY